MNESTQHPLRILAFVAILGTLIVTLILLVQVFTDGILG